MRAGRRARSRGRHRRRPLGLTAAARGRSVAPSAARGRSCRGARRSESLGRLSRSHPRPMVFWRIKSRGSKRAYSPGNAALLQKLALTPFPAWLTVASFSGPVHLLDAGPRSPRSAQCPLSLPIPPRGVGPHAMSVQGLARVSSAPRAALRAVAPGAHPRAGLTIPPHRRQPGRDPTLLAPQSPDFSSLLEAHHETCNQVAGGGSAPRGGGAALPRSHPAIARDHARFARGGGR